MQESGNTTRKTRRENSESRRQQSSRIKPSAQALSKYVKNKKVLTQTQCQQQKADMARTVPGIQTINNTKLEDRRKQKATDDK